MLIEDVLPGALAIGVPYDTFWHLNPLSLKAYEKAFKMKADAEAQRMDSVAWLHGAYTNAAIASALSKKVQYPKKPHGVKAGTGSPESAVAKFEKLASRMNAARKRKNKE